MNLRDELSDALCRDLRIRKQELLKLRHKLGLRHSNTYADSGDRQSTYLEQLGGTAEKFDAANFAFRTYYVLLYSHWEGGCKSALELYLEFLEKMDKIPDGVHNALFLNWAKHEASKIQKISTPSESSTTELLPRLRRLYAQDLQPDEELVKALTNTKSNLGGKRAIALFEGFDLSPESVIPDKQTSAALEHLVKIRNNIVHGQLEKDGVNFLNRHEAGKDGKGIGYLDDLVQDTLGSLHDSLIAKADSVLAASKDS